MVYAELLGTGPMLSLLAANGGPVGTSGLNGTLIVAIYAAVISSSLAVLEIAKFVRDRPKLDVGMWAELDLRGGKHEATVTVEVANNGRRDATITNVGAAVDPSLPRMAPPGGIPAGYKATPTTEIALIHPASPDLPRAVAPGQLERFVRDLNTMPLPLHVDAPFRPFVVDSRRRRAWCRQGFAPIRRLIEFGWNVPSSVGQDMLAPLPDTPKLPRIVPRWKIWTPKELRSRDTIEPSSGARLLLDR